MNRSTYSCEGHGTATGPLDRHLARPEVRRHHQVVGAHLVRSAGRDDLATGEGVDAIAEAHQQRHVELNDEDAALQRIAYLLQERTEGLGLALGETCSRLIQQQDTRG